MWAQLIAYNLWFLQIPSFAIPAFSLPTSSSMTISGHSGLKSQVTSTPSVPKRLNELSNSRCSGRSRMKIEEEFEDNLTSNLVEIAKSGVRHLCTMVIIGVHYCFFVHPSETPRGIPDMVVLCCTWTRRSRRLHFEFISLEPHIFKTAARADRDNAAITNSQTEVWLHSLRVSQKKGVKDECSESRV